MSPERMTAGRRNFAWPRLLFVLAASALIPELTVRPVWGQSAEADAEPPPDDDAAAPEQVKFSGWRVTPYASIREAYTDNARLTPQGSGDEVSTLTPGVKIEAATRRLTLSLDGNVSYDLYARNDDLDGYRYTVNGNGLGEIIEKYVYIDLRIAADRQPINQNGVVSAFDRSLSGNQTELVNASVSPYLTHDFAGWATGELRYRFSTLDYSNSSLSSAPIDPFTPYVTSDVTTQEVQASLRAGPRFSMFRWAAAAAASDSGFADGRVVGQRSASLTGEYAPLRELALLAIVGEDEFKDSLIASGNSVHPSWRVGARFDPGPRSNLLIEGGSRYGGPYWSGQFRYHLSKTLTLSASHQETVTTQQQLLGSDLNDLVRDDYGHLVDSLTGELTQPNASAFNAVASSFVLKTSRVALNGVEGRNSLSLSAEFDQRRLGDISLGQGGGERQQALLANLTLAHRLSAASDVSLAFSLGRNGDSLSDASYKIQRTSLNFNRDLSPHIRVTFGLERYQLGNEIHSGYVENAAMLTLRGTY